MSTRVHPIDPLDVAAAGRKSPAGNFGLFSAVSPPKNKSSSDEDDVEYAAYEAHQGRPRADSNASSTASVTSTTRRCGGSEGARGMGTRAVCGLHGGEAGSCERGDGEGG